MEAVVDVPRIARAPHEAQARATHYFWTAESAVIDKRRARRSAQLVWS